MEHGGQGEYCVSMKSQHLGFFLVLISVQDFQLSFLVEMMLLCMLLNSSFFCFFCGFCVVRS